jgi:phosphoglucosamine mutase
MSTLRLASFGMRGWVGDALSPEVVTDFVASFGTFVDGGKVIVCRDTRKSSPLFHAASVAGLASTGCEVLDFGICPTPILQFSVRQYGARGGVAISGGHTPPGVNAITLIGPQGSLLDPVGGETVLDMYHAHDFKRGAWNEIGAIRPVDDFAGPYFEALEQAIDAEAIRRAGFTVVIDPVNGAGCRYLAPFAKHLGLRLIPINDTESGYFAHDPEPRPRTASQAASIVRHAGADIGFVTSSDMARVSVISETGETASEEFTLALIARHVLQRQRGAVAVNVCSSRMVDDVADEAGVRLVKTPVGQAHIVSALIDERGVVGGEGSGGVVLPDFSRAFDGFMMMAQILEAMALRQCTISELLGLLPRYHIVKRQVQVEPHRGYRVLERIDPHATWEGNGRVDRTDGLRVDWDDGWVHVRASRTEPIVRVISESVDRELAAQRSQDAITFFEQA